MNGISTPEAGTSCNVARVASREEAEAVSAFLLQPGLFGTRLTPGEQEEFLTRPVAAIGQPFEGYWFVRNEQGALSAVIGIRMNAERTGIYEVSALAVHAENRRNRLGRRLLEFAVRHVAREHGRGLLFETSSDSSYAPMHHLLADLGFKQVGRFPDFYFPGEDTLWYYRAIES